MQGNYVNLPRVLEKTPAVSVLYTYVPVWVL